MESVKAELNQPVRKWTIEDFETVLDVLAGNRDSYAELVRKYESKVRGYCLVTLSNQEEADDAAQEVFIKAYNALGKYRADASFSTWIYRIAVNHCNDVLRKRMRRKTESWDALIEKEGERIERFFSKTPQPSSPAEDRELLGRLLEHLPEKSREVLVLREIQGLSYQEIAESLNCTLDAVKARLKRSRQEIDSKLRHLFPGEHV